MGIISYMLNKPTKLKLHQLNNRLRMIYGKATNE